MSYTHTTPGRHGRRWRQLRAIDRLEKWLAKSDEERAAHLEAMKGAPAPNSR